MPMINPVLAEIELRKLVRTKQPEAAMAQFGSVEDQLQPYSQYLLGHCFFQLGAFERASALWEIANQRDSSLFYAKNRAYQLNQFTDAVLGSDLKPEDEPLIHVLILTSNRAGLLCNLIEQLRSTRYKRYEVFVLDNGSSDETLEGLRKFSSCKFGTGPLNVFSLPTNIGRPAGHNLLLTHWNHAPAEHIAILDDDLISIEPNWLNQLVHTLQLDVNAGAVGTKTVGEDGLIQDAFPAFVGVGDGTEVHFHTRRGEEDAGQFDVINDFPDYVTGCCSLFRRDVFNKVGLFDIRFSPSQFVDIDHGLRMRQYGLNLLYNGNCGVVHAQLTHEIRKRSRSDLGNQRGNAYKLSQKYSHDFFSTLVEQRSVRQQQRAMYLA